MHSWLRSLLTLFLLAAFQAVWAQCPTAAGDQVSYGSGSWIGYVYDGVNTFAGANYQGTITETENFDESFCGDNCTFTAASGCSVTSETFTVRFKMQKAFACGTYQFNIGADDGVRLSIDGGATYLINTLYNDHAYQTTSASAFLTAGTYNLVLDFYENGGQNRVTFSSSNLGVGGTGGTIGTSQTLCQTTIDPAAFTNISSAFFCTGIAATYQWQDSPDAVTWTDISGATSSTYDVPSGLSAGNHYYRRRATDGTTTTYSNVVTVVGESPLGDQVTYGVNSWIGYVYDGANNYNSANYVGYFTKAAIFDESFCGDNCTFALNGCDIVTETYTVRFRMRITLPAAGYTFTVGADDGVRLSIDGGSTYVVNDYSDHGYRTASSSVINLSGTYDFVLDFYENGGGNRVSFTYTSGPLPVTWSFFDGYHQDGQNYIEWHTATELNNSGFEVQRSADGVAFDSIGFVAGNGTSRLPNTYNFIDSAPSYGWNYYRLKQIDLDGRIDYSRLIPVRSATLFRSAVFPNPATGELYLSRISSSETVSVILRNLVTGKSYTLSADREQPARFSLDRVDPGIYAASFIMDEEVYTEKLVVY